MVKNKKFFFSLIILIVSHNTYTADFFKSWGNAKLSDAAQAEAARASEIAQLQRKVTELQADLDKATGKNMDLNAQGANQEIIKACSRCIILDTKCIGLKSELDIARNKQNNIEEMAATIQQLERDIQQTKGEYSELLDQLMNAAQTRTDALQVLIGDIKALFAECEAEAQRVTLRDAERKQELEKQLTEFEKDQQKKMNVMNLLETLINFK